MKTSRFTFELAQAVALVAGMTYYAITNLRTPWPLALLCGLLFLAVVRFIQFLGRRVVRAIVPNISVNSATHPEGTVQADDSQSPSDPP